MTINIHHNNTIVPIKVNASSIISDRLMGGREVRINHTSREVLPLTIGNHITLNGETYTINTIPGYQKVSNFQHIYNIVFESDLYRLYDKKIKDEGEGDFPYFGTPLDFLNLLVDNINEIDQGWAVGNVEDIEGKTLSFENISCREALNEIAKAFNLEWSINGKTINMVKQVGNETALVFEYGKGKGLYSLSYSYQSDKNIVTRGWGYGSTRNLPKGYRGNAKHLKFNNNISNNDDIYKSKRRQLYQ